MSYELQLSLQHKAALSASLSLWEKQPYRDKIKELANSSLTDNEKRDEWRKYVKTVVDEGNQKVLAPAIECELINCVRGIGEKIYNWFLYIWRGSEFPFDGQLNYSDEIHWTPHGLIDEVAIFKSFLPTYLSKNLTLYIDELYYVACYYMMEEQILDLWQKADSDQYLCDEAIDEYEDRYICAYFRYCRENNLDNLIEYFNDAADSYDDHTEYVWPYNSNYSPEANTMIASASVGNSIAVQCFWDKLTDEEKARCVMDSANLAVNNYNWYDLDENKPIYQHKKEKYIGISIFLINQMTENQKKLFFQRGYAPERDTYDSWDEERDVKNTVLRMLSYAWPFQELIIPVFHDMLKYLEHDKKTIRIFLFNITSKLIEDQKLGYNINTSKFQQIFNKVWNNIPRSFKQNKACLGVNMIITNLLEVQDLKSLHMIINDPEVADVKDQYIECGRIGFLKLILKNQYEILDRFIEEIFRSDDEKKCFKQKIHLWGDSTLDDQYCTADKVLNYRICLPNSPKRPECEIKYISLCEYFEKQQRHDLADKFLEWKRGSDEEKKV